MTGFFCCPFSTASLRQLPSLGSFTNSPRQSPGFSRTCLSSPTSGLVGDLESKPFVWFRAKTDKGVVCLVDHPHSVTYFIAYNTHFFLKKNVPENHCASYKDKGHLWATGKWNRKCKQGDDRFYTNNDSLFLRYQCRTVELTGISCKITPLRKKIKWWHLNMHLPEQTSGTRNFNLIRMWIHMNLLKWPERWKLWKSVENLSPDIRICIPTLKMRLINRQIR